MDVAGAFYETLVREMGQRLRPAARLLAAKIMDGTAGDVPDWGYTILSCVPDESVSTLVPFLADANMVMRERATVALGYMGAVASPAKDQVAAAIAKAASEREAPDEVVPPGDQSPVTQLPRSHDAGIGHRR